MATDPYSKPPGLEPYDAVVEPPPKERGCFFYGCIIASVLAVLMLLALALGGYFGYKAYLGFVQQYTSTARVALPKVEMPEAQREALLERFRAFRKALEKGEDAEPLVLTGDELNVLLAGNADVADKVHFIIEGDVLKGEVSLPLSGLGLPGLKGRYFNGKATFLASLRDGQLDVRIDSAEVNGKPISEQIMTELRNTNMAQDAAKDPDNARFLNKLDSIEIEDGKITIKARPKAERTRLETKPEASEDEDAKSKEAASEKAR
jgi:hypothetical protein